MANILFRMANSFCENGAGNTGATGKPMPRVPQCSGNRRPHTRHFRGIVVEVGTRRGSQASSVAEPRQRVDCRPRSRFDIPSNQPETFEMTITAAHVPAIVALIAGILILLMPRLLNFIVAIYLIFVGLVGLGVLKMFHL
jgi:hypothetical protein